MNKDEVLAKAKKENFLGDEREREVRVKRNAFSSWGLIILGVIIMIIKLKFLLLTAGNRHGMMRKNK